MSSEDYVAYHGWVYLKNAIDSHQFGLRIQFALDHEDDFKIFKDVKKHRKNRAGSGGYRILMRMTVRGEWEEPVDMLFISWSLSATNGAVVTFEMEDYDRWHKLRHSPALASGYERAGLDKIEVMMIELDDDGKPINVEQRAKLERMALKRKWPKGGSQSKRAARLCREEDFRRWVALQINWDSAGLPKNPEVTPEVAADWMRTECDLDTRAQLDHDPAALQRFEDRVIKPFLRSTM